ncbi:MAG: DNA repair protein RadC [Armatimonadetes bacterium]|nr:DNA repair protein RadC [Armatimonadota bacterium]
MIKDLPPDERPRERLVKYGPDVLSMAELLAILIRTGTTEHSALDLAECLLSEFGSVKRMVGARVEQLASIKGVGIAKACQIKAAIELGARIAAFTEDSKPAVRSPSDVVHLMMPELRYEDREHMKALFLDVKNQVIRVSTISIGGLNVSLIHPRELFKEAICCAAASVIVCHNHPSGDPTPSQEDIEVTKRLVEAGKIIGVDLLDHVIIGDGKFVSLKEKELL